MFAVIGLGNPGRRYEGTRHNVGFSVVQKLSAQRQGGSHWFERGGALYQRVQIETQETLLIMPQKFMNVSGAASAPLLSFYKVPPEQVIVVHDELDLEPGVIRLKLGGRAAGHRGVEDLIRTLGTDKFHRVRIGIGHPRRTSESIDGTDRRAQIAVSDWVLSQPSQKEQLVFEEVAIRAAHSVSTLISVGLKEAQQQFH